MSTEDKCVGFDLEKAKGTAAALGAMADNATLHANTPLGVLVGYHVIDGAAVCCVAKLVRQLIACFSFTLLPTAGPR